MYNSIWSTPEIFSASADLTYEDYERLYNEKTAKTYQKVSEAGYKKLVEFFEISYKESYRTDEQEEDEDDE